MWVDELDRAIQFACDYAPEHLLLAVRQPRLALEKVRNAGAVFLGQTSSVTFGDYITGSNHVLPTAGFSRTHSALSVYDFLRWTTYQEVDESAATRLASDVATLAEVEGLPGHAAAARQWCSEVGIQR
jgi:histidinol dehydrogenase